jgi:uncharacterized cupin superfamily protein
MADVTVKREDELDTAFGGAFRLARHSLGLSSFGLQILQMPPNADGYPVHDHGEDGQEECYIAIAGSAELIVGDETHTLEPGVLARVGSGQERKVVPGDDGIRLIVVGGVPGKAYEIPDFTVPKQDG